MQQDKVLIFDTTLRDGEQAAGAGLTMDEKYQFWAETGQSDKAEAAKGTTEIERIYHIDRGYDDIELKLASLGADIRRVKE